ncbi:hypothetical protein J2785_006570 [Burkholderia ambifaria]|nr:hypothetical protein [Burkholderia ambifaria]
MLRAVALSGKAAVRRKGARAAQRHDAAPYRPSSGQPAARSRASSSPSCAGVPTFSQMPL